MIWGRKKIKKMRMKYGRKRINVVLKKKRKQE